MDAVQHTHKIQNQISTEQKQTLFAHLSKKKYIKKHENIDIKGHLHALHWHELPFYH
jgi:hypothetical protein